MSWLLGLNKGQPNQPDFSQLSLPVPPGDGGSDDKEGSKLRSKDSQGQSMEAYRFDSAAFERAAKAAKYLESSPHARESLEVIKQQEITKQMESAIKVPCGRKRKRVEEIVVNLADHLTGASLEQVKHLTIEKDIQISHSKERSMPTSRQKRNHQITFLAHQAKERELELKNQWAENNFSKKQTRSKYGF